jgi:hypothetical protein
VTIKPTSKLLTGKILNTPTIHTSNENKISNNLHCIRKIQKQYNEMHPIKLHEQIKPQTYKINVLPLLLAHS